MGLANGNGNGTTRIVLAGALGVIATLIGSFAYINTQTISKADVRTEILEVRAEADRAIERNRVDLAEFRGEIADGRVERAQLAITLAALQQDVVDLMRDKQTQGGNTP